MSVKLAILTALAGSPGRRATFDDIRRDVATIVARGDQTVQAERFAGLGDVDIFGSGFVVRDDTGLQITDAGVSLLHWLEGKTTSEPLPPISPAAAPFESIDGLLGAETRRKFFELELRPQQQAGEPSIASQAHSDLVQSESAGQIRKPQETGPKPQLNQAASMDASLPKHDAEATLSAPDRLDEASSAPLGFPPHKFGAENRHQVGRSNFVTRIEALIERGGEVWRRHLEQDMQRRPTRVSSKKAERPIFAFLAILIFVSGACVVFALMEVKAARTELVALKRELLPLKERLSRLEQSERSKQALDRPSSLRERLSGAEAAGQPQPAQAPHAPQPALVLSREELQVVRDFIKPAPTPGSPTPPIGVGDPILGPTFPVPPAVSEKVPKLIGARFTISNGSIIIVKSGSRHADAVLGQN